MGWLVCVFQCNLCVWVFDGDLVDWWLCVFQLSGCYTCIYFWIKDLLLCTRGILTNSFLAF